MLILILSAFFLVILIVITLILNKFYVISNIGNSHCYYQLIDANTLEIKIDDVNNRLLVDERDYLDINCVTFVLFLIYILRVNYCVSSMKPKEIKFFDMYFTKHCKTIIY